MMIRHYSDYEIRECIFDESYPKDNGDFFYESGIEWSNDKLREYERKYGHNYWCGKADLRYIISVLYAAGMFDVEMNENERHICERAIHWTREKNFMKADEVKKLEEERSGRKRRY